MSIKIILASESIRRAELLNQIDIDFDIIPSCFDENSIQSDDPIDYVKTLAFKKAESIQCSSENYNYVLGADTVVVIDNHILGKPQNEQEAYQFLKLLSGREHVVYTGVSIIRTWDKKTITNYKATQVSFDTLSDADIQYYISTKEPFDKAGGYGIQGIGARFIKEIHGDYFNVVGLPLNLVIQMLNEMGEENEQYSNG